MQENGLMSLKKKKPTLLPFLYQGLIQMQAYASTDLTSQGTAHLQPPLHCLTAVSWAHQSCHLCQDVVKESSGGFCNALSSLTRGIPIYLHQHCSILWTATVDRRARALQADCLSGLKKEWLEGRNWIQKSTISQSNVRNYIKAGNRNKLPQI